MAETIEYTSQEVAQHKSPEDVWMIIHGKVYDVTKYLESHPGGTEVLTEAAGTDVSEAFDNAGHSEDAFELMAGLCIGKLKGARSKPKAVRITSPPSERSDSTAKKQSGNPKIVTFALLSLSTAALSYYGIHKSGSTLPGVSTMFSPGAGSHKLGFLQGFLLGAAVLTTIDTFVVQKILELIRKEENVLSLPAHLKLPKRTESDILNQRGWLTPANSPLPLAQKTIIAPNVYRLTFELPSPQSIVGLPTGQHVAITAEVDGETVTRSYTPVSNNSDNGILELVIKVYPDGKLTNGYLANLEVGDEVQFRGPKGAMRYSRGLCKKIGMLAGGTGITPMFQLIRAICENDRDTTEISLIYANRTEQDILLREELDSFSRRYPKSLKVHYLLDKPSEDWKFGTGYVTKDMMAERFPSPGEDAKIMLCGPPGMVNAAKKSLIELGFKQPGAMSKMTDDIFLF